jgi:hypothetical protein
MRSIRNQIERAAAEDWGRADRRDRTSEAPNVSRVGFRVSLIAVSRSIVSSASSALAGAGACRTGSQMRNS